jgi:hypothetical protein
VWCLSASKPRLVQTLSTKYGRQLFVVSFTLPNTIVLTIKDDYKLNSTNGKVINRQRVSPGKGSNERDGKHRMKE